MPIPDPKEARDQAYWRANLHVLAVLLSIWAVCAFLLSIVFVEPLNQYRLMGFPLGFWFAQQGSIYVFIVLILGYALWMDRLERRMHRDDDEEVAP